MSRARAKLFPAAGHLIDVMDETPTNTPYEAPALPPAAVLPADVLPNDLGASHTLISQLAVSISELQDSRTRLAQEVEELKLTITKLLARLAGHQRERVVCDPNQLPLDFGDDPQAQDALAEAAAEAEKIVQEYTVRREINKQKKPPRTEKFPEHLEGRSPSLHARYRCAKWICDNRLEATQAYRRVRIARLLRRV